MENHDMAEAQASAQARAGAALVSLSGAGAKSGGRWRVRGVDLRISPGEIVTLIGPNGSGKSTAAKMALGLLAPDEGAAHRRPGLKTGYVPQTLAVDWTLPLRVDRFMRLTGRVSDDAAARALAMTGAGALAKVEMRALSGGEFQRVMMARAIARGPDLMVLDEPVSGVDYAGETAIYGLIQTLRRDLGCGVLLISHDLHVVMAETDRVICLNGHVCCSGSPAEVAADAAFQALFGARAQPGPSGLPEPPRLSVYQHHHDHEHLPGGQVRHSDGSVTDHCHPDDGHHG